MEIDDLGPFAKLELSRDLQDATLFHIVGSWLQGRSLNNNKNTESGGQRGWDLGFPSLHRRHSGAGRKDTQNGKRCWKNTDFNVILELTAA